MFYLVDLAYLTFAFITLYFTVMFFLLFFENKGNIQKIPELVRYPFVSIVVPAYNEEDTVGRTVQNLKKLIYPKNKFEIIVVNDGSTDRTGEIVKSIKGVRIFEKPNQGRKAFALNFGIKKAKGEITACVDADSFPRSDSLLKTIPFFNDPLVGAVTTSVIVKEPKKLIQKLQFLEYTMIVWSRKLLEFIDGIYVTPGSMSLYRKNVLEEIGYFDEKNITEDIEVAWKILRKGYKIKMSMPAKVYTDVPSSFNKWWKQRIRWNIGGFQTSIKHVDAVFKSRFKSFGMFVVPFFLISYAVSVLGFGLLLYMLGQAAYNYSDLLLKSFLYSSPIDVSRAADFIMLPNVFTVFGFGIFALSLIWVLASLKSTGMKIDGLKGIYTILIYLSLYITIFPVVLLYSAFKFLRGKGYKWR